MSRPKIIKLLNLYDVTAEQSTFRELLNECRKNEEFTDVQLQVGDKLFHAHRAVLSLYSPVIKAAISEHWSTTSVCPISDEFVDVEIMEDLLGFLYTGKIELVPENAHSVCMAAHYLQIQLLLEISLERLCELITTENLLTLLEFSNSYQLEPLRKSCFRFFQEEHDQVFQNPKILEFSFKDFYDLIVGLKNDASGSVLRENTFHLIVRWIEKDHLNRLNNLRSLLQNFPLEELSHQFFTETVFPHNLVKKSISCGQLVDSLSTQRALERFVVLGGTNAKIRYEISSSSMTCYDSKSRIWRKLPDMKHPRAYFGATVTNQRNIIVCGGYVGKDAHGRDMYSNSAEMFNWETQTWNEFFRLPDQIGFLGPLVGIHNNCLYVAGGAYDERTGSNVVLCFSFKTNQWKYVKSMNYQRSAGNLISYKGYLYAISSNSGPYETIERYDSVRDQWTTIAQRTSRPRPNSTISAALHQDRICILTDNIVDVYDPERNRWICLPEQLPLYGASLVSVNGKLLAVGGCIEGEETINDVIYEFNSSTNKWTKIGRMELGATYHCSVVGNFI